MRKILDFHIHSKYSMACSKQLEPAIISDWAKIKGIDIVGTSDFTHPLWLKSLKTELVESAPGLFRHKDKKNDAPQFLLTTEISCIYKLGGKARRLHILLFASSFKAVDKIIKEFNRRNFNLKSDGRPIIGCSGKELTEIVLTADENAMVIPAHIWTPWFAVFGSKSGFDSLEECFEEYTPYIYAAETGLSSDPAMNWRLSELDNITLISNSDAHSPSNLGREANVFNIEPNNLNYQEITRILKEKDKEKFLYTIEFFPEEGRYHIDGHAKCGFSCEPVESIKNKNICPVCKKPLTLGVSHRVEELADRNTPKKEGQIPYKSIIPLQTLISEALGKGVKTKTVQEAYETATRNHSEFDILLDLPAEELVKDMDKEIVEAVVKTRVGKIKTTPGYDGVYGRVEILKDSSSE